MSLLNKFSKLIDDDNKRRIPFIIFITIISSVLELLSISLMLPFISAILNNKDNDKYILFICRLFKINNNETLIYLCISLLIIVFILKELFILYCNYYRTCFIYDCRIKCQGELLTAIMNRPYEYFLNLKTGEVIRNIQGDVLNAFSLLSSTIALISDSFVAISIVAYIFIISFKMSLFLAVILFILLIILRLIIKPILVKKGQIARNNASISNKWLMEAIRGIKNIKIAKKEDLFIDNYKEAINKHIESLKCYKLISSLPRSLIETWCVCGLLITVMVMLKVGYTPISLLPTIGTYCMAAIKLMPYVNRLSAYDNSLAFNGGALDRVVENLNMCTSEKAIETNSKLTLKDKIEINNLTYKYPNTDKYILKNANMLVELGKSIGIIGKSGAGKTTLVDLLLGLLKQENGEILIDGKNIKENYCAWLSTISYIPQDIFLLDDSIASNICFGNAFDEKKVWKVLRQAQLDKFVKQLPESLNTLIGERGIRLSGGQRQRLGIARALYSDPQILIFDEATSSLDKQTEKALIDSIDSLHHKKTLIIVAHDPQTIKNCDVIYCVKNTKIHKVN